MEKVTIASKNVVVDEVEDEGNTSRASSTLDKLNLMSRVTRSTETLPKRFLEGDLVEVRQTEKGLRGAWFKAVVVGVLPRKRIVEYDDILVDEGSTQKLRETINVSAIFDGQSQHSFLKFAARAGKPLIRPRPTWLSYLTPISWTEGTWVDCWYEDAWWEGILNEDVGFIEKLESHLILTRKTEVVVSFPLEKYASLKLQVKDIRLTQDYHGDGTWSQRGHRQTARPLRKSSNKEEGQIVQRQLSFTKADKADKQAIIISSDSEDDSSHTAASSSEKTDHQETGKVIPTKKKNQQSHIER